MILHCIDLYFNLVMYNFINEKPYLSDIAPCCSFISEHRLNFWSKDIN